MSFSETSSVRDENKEFEGIVDKMRERLKKSRKDSNMFEGIRDINLYHGLKLASSTPLIGTFAEICYCSETKEYLVLDTGTMVHRYSMQGKPIRPSHQLSSTMLFTRMLWCPDAKVSVCFIPHDDMIWIITASCKLLQIVRNEFRIEEIFYSSSSNEMIVVGTNKITVYPMHDTEHPLNSLHTLNFMDSSFGSLWRIENSSLIERSFESAVLTLAGSYLTTLYIMSLKSEKETEGPSEFMAKKIGATRAAITAIYYHRMSEWIITGDQLGNVSSWNLQLECIMSCLDGHEGQVRGIIRHPSICGFLTFDDSSLQIWSCNLRDKIEDFREIGEIWRIAVNESATSVASLGTKLNCFHMHQLYVFYASLTAPATNLYSTTNPTFSTRVIVTSSDNSVRILSSQNGRLINVQILSPKLEVVAASYSGITSALTIKIYNYIYVTGKSFPTKLQETSRTFFYAISPEVNVNSFN